MEPSTQWLEAHCRDLVDVARGAQVAEGGFGYLGDDGVVLPERGVELYITCRMTHVFALEQLRGDASCASLVEHGIAALEGPLHDTEHGGWFARVGPGSEVDATKAGYAHAFVVLAAASAAAAGHASAQRLLAEALVVFEEHFWVEEEGATIDAWDRTWTTPEPYRGANANMHVVEALLAAHDVTGDPVWRDRALRITERLIHGEARRNDWRLPEHFDADWQPMPEFNRDRPNDPFRPFGATIGHLFEWARLCLHLREALGESGADDVGPDETGPDGGTSDPRAWLLADAVALFDRGVSDGWAVDGADGFVYTVDFDGVPVVRDRMFWVPAEGVAAAWELEVVTGDSRYADHAATWWAYVREFMVDGGSWRHELDPQNQPAATVWPGRPDTYHAYQAALLPLLGRAAIVSFAGAVGRA